MTRDYKIEFDGNEYFCSEFYDLVSFRSGVTVVSVETREQNDLYDINLPKSEKEKFLFELKVKNFIRENF